MEVPNEAIELAKRTDLEAVDLMDSIADSAHNETAKLLHLLRENYTGWVRFRDGGER
jgi:uncharacterized protein Yka (UPF0111/DUF47 family)